LEYWLEQLTQERFLEILRSADTAAAVVTTRKGAIRAMPEKREIMELLNKKFK